MDYRDLLYEFKNDWSDQGHGKKSTNSYLSYIRQGIKTVSDVLEKNGQKRIDAIAIQKTKSRTPSKLLEKLYILAVAVQHEQCNLPNAPRKPKTYQNRISGISALYHFMNKAGYRPDNSAIPLKDLNRIIAQHQGKYEYTNKEICRMYRNRLNTQDRVYEHCIFNMCVICNVLALDKDSAKKVTAIKSKKLKDMVFLCSSDGTQKVKLQEIENLRIVSGSKCEVITSKNRFALYTEKPDASGNFNGSTFEEMKAVDLVDISIDHNTPIKNLLENCHTEYPAIDELSVKIANVLNVCKTDYRKGRKTINDINKTTAQDIIKKENIDEAFAKRLRDDLLKFYEKISYTAMYRPYNSKKSDS